MFNNSNRQKVQSVVATNFILRRTGTYQQQFHRAYEMVGDFNSVNRLSALMSEGRHSTVTPSLLGNIGGLVGINAATQGQVAIPNNWNTSRGVFMLQLNVTYEVGGMTQYFVQGFTDADGFTDHHVDPNLRMYINNVVAMTPVMINDATFGSIQSARMSRSFQPMTDFSIMNGGSAFGNHLMRPQDVFNQMRNHEFTGFDVTVTDSTDRISNTNLQTSRRANSIPTQYVSSIINNYAAAKMLTDVADPTSDSVAGEALKQALESESFQDTFLKMLRKASDQQGGIKSNMSYRDLCAVAPNVDQIKSLKAWSSAGTRLVQAGDSESFHGQTKSVVTAVELATTIPALMMECMLSSVSFKATNTHNFGGVSQMVVLESNILGFVRELEVQHFQNFKTRLINEVLNNITSMNMINLDLQVECSFHSDCIISIKIADDPQVDFVTPAFCDSLYSPVVTPLANWTHTFAGTMTHVCDQLADTSSEVLRHRDRISVAGFHQPVTGAFDRSNGSAMTLPGMGQAPARPLQSVFETTPSADRM